MNFHSSVSEVGSTSEGVVRELHNHDFVNALGCLVSWSVPTQSWSTAPNTLPSRDTEWYPQSWSNLLKKCPSSQIYFQQWTPVERWPQTATYYITCQCCNGGAHPRTCCAKSIPRWSCLPVWSLKELHVHDLGVITPFNYYQKKLSARVHNLTCLSKTWQLSGPLQLRAMLCHAFASAPANKDCRKV